MWEQIFGYENGTCRMLMSCHQAPNRYDFFRHEVIYNYFILKKYLFISNI